MPRSRRGVGPEGASPLPSPSRGRGPLRGLAPLPPWRPDRRELIERFIELINETAFQVRLVLGSASGDIDLTMPQFRALTILRAGRRHMSDIARALGTRLPSVTSLMDRLEERGLVQRSTDPQDRRAVWCELTPRGQQEAERLWQMSQEGSREIAGRLRDDELETAVRGLETVLIALARFPQQAQPPRLSA